MGSILSPDTAGLPLGPYYVCDIIHRDTAQIYSVQALELPAMCGRLDCTCIRSGSWAYFIGHICENEDSSIWHKTCFPQSLQRGRQSFLRHEALPIPWPMSCVYLAPLVHLAALWVFNLFTLTNNLLVIQQFTLNLLL